MRSARTPSAWTHAPEVSPPATTSRRAPRSTSARATSASSVSSSAPIRSRPSAPARRRPLRRRRCCRRAPAGAASLRPLALGPARELGDELAGRAVAERQRIDAPRRAAALLEVRHLGVASPRSSCPRRSRETRSPAAAPPPRFDAAMPKLAGRPIARPEPAQTSGRSLTAAPRRSRSSFVDRVGDRDRRRPLSEAP